MAEQVVQPTIKELQAEQVPAVKTYDVFTHDMHVVFEEHVRQLLRMVPQVAQFPAEMAYEVVLHVKHVVDELHVTQLLRTELQVTQFVPTKA